ncbi:MAG: UDP-N-acetylglucosamine 2-epimerase (non-hydrolyzing) [Deltaproteobacteria bacterium]|nr:UDP-N-acetylglucosamine 2-epimerase (non-hydrolyzing) [Deltaproteobacteria bacterium]
MSDGVLVVFGTRPEAVKLAPVVNSLRGRVDVKVCVTAQHRQMLDQVLDAFAIRPDFDLDLMKSNQDLFDITANALLALRQVLSQERPRLVLVQGDTTTTFVAALASFYLRVEVGHVEAGLRTHDKQRPFPEEINRHMTTALADWHFPPTEWARDNLRHEHVAAERIFVTGNTGIDALLSIVTGIETGRIKPTLPPEVTARLGKGRMILVTGHRRESFGGGFENICQALRRIVDAHPDLTLVYPVHLNPNVQEPVHRLLGNHDRIVLTPPLDYVPFVDLMRRATLILTDSGGIQEEAPSIGKPVLVMRETTERPEGVKAGVARLVGTNVERIVSTVHELLTDAAHYRAMASPMNPYGDGKAAERIAVVVEQIVAGKQPNLA